jgi:lantibiotic leader peptide-processing serine protease
MLDAADRGFDVINMSLGGLTYKGGKGTNELNAFIQAENRVAKYVIDQGTTIVASAGNAGVDLTGLYYNLPGSVPGIINVGATGIRPNPRYEPGVSYDVRAFYSNYGSKVDISAPGGDCGLPDSCDPATRPANWFEYLILSSIVAPNPACAATASCPVGYGWKGGTSMAAPHVAGVAGLVHDTNSNLNPHQVTALLKRTADSVGNRLVFGHGVVNADAATR